jgi:hypothetical protein
VWMDKAGNVVNMQDDAYGLPCTIRITCPELCIVADEVGSNTSQKGDRHVGGKKLVCEFQCVPQEKASNNQKHVTMLSFTALTGEPVMCAVIIQGTNRQLEMELGVDFMVDAEKTGSDKDWLFIDANKGQGKRFPGDPTCIYKGKEIPCFVQFQESGGMAGEISLDIFKTFDHYQLFDDDRTNGRTPFFLLDGHNSRFHLPFVNYINEDRTKYAVTIGVPYGTSYWQVGDSSEQNGSFKMAMMKAKDEILKRRERLGIGELGIQPLDIILLISNSWTQPFAKVESNKKAIAERGWFPYNRNLMKIPQITATAPHLNQTTPDSSRTQMTDIEQEILASPQLAPFLLNLDKVMGHQ